MTTKRGKLYIVEFESPLGLFCKVGKSIHPKSRVYTLKQGFNKIKGIKYKQAYVSNTLKDYSKDEKEVHKSLRPYRNFDLNDLVEHCEGGTECFLTSSKKVIEATSKVINGWKPYMVVVKSNKARVGHIKAKRTKKYEKEAEENGLEFMGYGTKYHRTNNTCTEQAVWYFVMTGISFRKEGFNDPQMVVPKERFDGYVEFIHKKTGKPKGVMYGSGNPYCILCSWASYKGNIVGPYLTVASSIVPEFHYDPIKEAYYFSIDEHNLDEYKEFKRNYKSLSYYKKLTDPHLSKR